MRQSLSRDAVSGITDFNLRISHFITHRLIKAQSDAPLLRIFDGVGNQIIQNNGNDFLVKEKKHLLFFYLNPEVNFSFLVELLVFKPCLVDKGGDISFADT